jgi:hypothetical protein
MHKSTITQDARLDVAFEPVKIVYLTQSGLLPDQVGIISALPPAEEHQFRELPPQNLTENILMSMWLNTHQAMFMSTGLSACCITIVSGLIRDQTSLEIETDEITHYLELAHYARLASAAYTGLPHLTRDLYEAYIRESMRLVHPGFSGVSNQEAIAMEKSLHELKNVQTELAYRNKLLGTHLLPYFNDLYAADRRWWRFHGLAMSKLVETPISLARMDFSNTAKANENFDEYRNKVLRNTKVLGEYDRYFAVRRKDGLSIEDYRNQLQACLRRSEPYVNNEGELAMYREQGYTALFKILDLEEKKLATQ